MNCYVVPKAIIKKVNFAQAKFWRGKENNKFCSFLKRKSVCLSKHFGGIGIRDLSTMNMALLTKLAWRIIIQRDTLLAKIIHAEYGMPDGEWRKRNKLTMGLSIVCEQLARNTVDYWFRRKNKAWLRQMGSSSS